MSPRIQGGRPGPNDFVFRVFFGGGMTLAEIAAVGDVLGDYVWFDDHLDGGLLCWVDTEDIENTVVGGFSAWWPALQVALGNLGASSEEVEE